MLSLPTASEARITRVRTSNIVTTEPIKLSRYRPPEEQAELRLRNLLAGTPRDNLSDAQLSLLGGSHRPPAGDEPIYLSGDLGLLRRQCVSVIGTRKVSEAGAARARRLAKELVGHGVVVVSGLAEGVDTNAMRSALQNNGRTIGVIGTPLDQAYPAANRGLQEDVYRDHLLISQFGAGSRVYRSNFPQRNRLMAMISDATVVIEASDTSGTLHQAAECTRLGRWLFIARSVVEDETLIWPKRFLPYAKCRILTSTEELVQTVYAA